MAQLVKNLPANAGDPRDTVSILGSERFSGERNGYPLQYSCLKNSIDRGAWWATVHGVTKNQTLFSMRAHLSIYTIFWFCFSVKKLIWGLLTNNYNKKNKLEVIKANQDA